jgi:HNH endonuclease
MAYRRKRAPAEQRFWARVDQENNPLHPYDPSLGRCWPWVGTPGTFHRDGYGYLSYEGKAQLAHRIAWRLVKGEIPEGLELTHSCNYPPCCNPDHCVPATHKQNKAYRAKTGRCANQPKGEQQGVLK